MACVPCEDGVRRELEQLAGAKGLFAQLVWAGADALTPSSGRKSSGPVVKVSKTVAPPPVRIGAMNLLGAGGVVQTLQRWVGMWYKDLGFRDPSWSGPHQFVTVVSPTGEMVRRPGQLDRTVLMLTNNLPWAVEHRHDFGSFTKDVHKFIDASKSALDPTIEQHSKILIGRCPTTLPDGRPCGAQLMADPFATSIRCYDCSASWKRQDWPTLGRTLGTS